METREEMETQTQGQIQGARKKQRVQGLGQKRDKGCHLSELIGGPPGTPSTTDPAEVCLTVAPTGRKPHLTSRKLMLRDVESLLRV